MLATLMHRSSVNKCGRRAHEIDAHEDELVVSRARCIHVKGDWLVQVHTQRLGKGTEHKFALHAVPAMYVSTAHNVYGAEPDADAPQCN